MHIDIVLAIAIGTLSILMAAMGGVIATEKKVLKFSFVIMGLLSVVLVIFQAMGAARSQDALTTSVQQLSKAQAELHDLNTGGDAFPFVEMTGVIEKNGLPKGVLLSVENRSKTRSLYSVTVEIIYGEYLPNGAHIKHLQPDSDRRHFPEIPPSVYESIPGDFPFRDSRDVYEVLVSARNGQFVATISSKSNTFVCTVKREGSDAVLEEFTSVLVHN